MPPKSSAASPWLGAPPVCEDGFAFANGDFFAEASGQNRHRRVAVAELKALFSSGSDKEHPAHWFEAQLIHYGLPSSKTKSVARMRLFDAVNAGKLIVPKHIVSLESKLKKEWTKKDREAKKELKGETKTETKTKKTVTTEIRTVITEKRTVTTEKKADTKKTTKTTESKAGVKRKAEANVGSKTGASSLTGNSSKQPAAKRAKSTAPKKPASTVASGTKPTANKIPPGIARRGGVWPKPGRATATTVPSPEPVSRPKQTARRSSAFMARGRIPAPQIQYDQNTSGYNQYDSNDDYDRMDIDSDGYGYDSSGGNDAPPPYSEYDGYEW
ncbi:hypothetical protein F5884DRAFT_443147 [Xylogone sp. PMI_703]|nr:hypothetical protein F5884DRAFT_443147 [Xylogone sp. PMI_703]